MRKLYTTLITKMRSIGRDDYLSPLVTNVFTNSQQEAIGTAIEQAEAKFPSSDGWIIKGNVVAFEIPEDVIRAAYQEINSSRT